MHPDKTAGLTHFQPASASDSAPSLIQYAVRRILGRLDKIMDILQIRNRESFAKVGG